MKTELMGDDEFLNNIGNGSVTDDSGDTGSADADTGTTETAPETPAADTQAATDVAPQATDTAPADTTEETKPETSVDDQEKGTDNANQDSSVGSTESTTVDTSATKDESSEQKPAETASTEAAPSYEELYKKVMAPFKANGKMIDLKDPAEAIQLMQMGANYTRKLQELQPHRKMLLMLQNNGLLDENKLSFLIDLDKRNPEAIKKLVKEAGIDPLDIDTSKEPAYQTGNHKVTDAEANFRQVLDEIGSTTDGKITIQAINDGWDQASKEVLWKQPELMATMHNQREAGVYQIVVDEIQRQQVLGKLPTNVPFIEAYRTVGDELLKTDAFDHLPAIKQLKPQKTPAVVATRTFNTKPAVVNGDKASAASPSRSTPRTATTVNPLSMSDDDFLKQMEHRL